MEKDGALRRQKWIAELLRSTIEWDLMSVRSRAMTLWSVENGRREDFVKEAFCFAVRRPPPRMILELSLFFGVIVADVETAEKATAGMDEEDASAIADAMWSALRAKMRERLGDLRAAPSAGEVVARACGLDVAEIEWLSKIVVPPDEEQGGTMAKKKAKEKKDGRKATESTDDKKDVVVLRGTIDALSLKAPKDARETRYLRSKLCVAEFEADDLARLCSDPRAAAGVMRRVGEGLMPKAEFNTSSDAYRLKLAGIGEDGEPDALLVCEVGLDKVRVIAKDGARGVELRAEAHWIERDREASMLFAWSRLGMELTATFERLRMQLPFQDENLQDANVQDADVQNANARKEDEDASEEEDRE